MTVRVRAVNNTTCEVFEDVISPQCNCGTNPPMNTSGDVETCSDEPFPPMTVSVAPMNTADWYDAPVGGTLLASGTTSFIPTAPGTYYAEEREPNDCTSTSRTPIVATEYPLPTYVFNSENCSVDLTIYACLLYTSDAADD